MEGVGMKLLLAHDDEGIQKLIGSLEMYNATRELINNIIRYSYEIPIESTHVRL